MFTRVCSGSLSYLTAFGIAAAGGAVHAFTTRTGGVSKGIYESLNLGRNCGDEKENVVANFRLMADALGISPGSFVLANQAHSDGVRIVTSADAGKGLTNKLDYEADALITSEKGLALTVTVADCTPVLLYDPVLRVIGAVHAGWRGTALGISGKAIGIMRDDFGCDPRNILAAIGPSIGRCCYETDSDVPGALRASMGGAASCFYVDNGTKYHVDLKGANAFWLVSNGVPVKNISLSEECTSCLCDKYWSHRKTNGRRGSQAAIICLL